MADNLSKLAENIDKMYQKPGVLDLKVAIEEPGFYLRSAKSFLEGVESKDGEKKEPVFVLNIAGVGEAVNTAKWVAAEVEKDGLGSIKKIQTSYPEFVSFGATGPIFQTTSRVEIEVYNSSTASRL